MNEERLTQILVAPIVSEKSTRLGDECNQVVFRVRPGSRKLEIKHAVEKMFNVDVTAVRTLNVRGKRKTFQRKVGKRPDWKKAYVTLAPGQDIDFLATE